MSVINTNITSLIAQGNLSKSQSALQTAMERLSSGLRINSAKDDAAGQAIANRMTAQITGLQQAQRNANDGISIAQTAEGSLNQVNDNLQRIRELAVQAANDTNSPEDRQSIQDEINQRLAEIDRISAETSFNGVDVLASDQGLRIQVGANDGQSITVNLKEINSSTLSLSNFDVTNKSLDTSKLAATPTTETVAASLNIQDVNLSDTAAASTWDIYVDDTDPDILYVSDDAGTTVYTATYDSSTNSLSFNSSSAATPSGTVTQASGTDGVHVGGGVTMEAQDITGRSDSNAAATPSLYVDEAGAYHVSLDGGSTFFAASSIDMDSTSATYGLVEFNSSGANSTPTATSAVLDQVSDPSSSVAIDTSGLDTDLVGSAAEVYQHEDGSYVVKGEVDGQAVYYQAEVDTGTGAVTLGDKLNADPLASLDSALNQVDSLRSELGAIQNRFSDAINNLNTNATNLSAARSRIEDADYAVEVANMTRAQILQQAGTSVLAQANQIPQIALSLLG